MICGIVTFAGLFLGASVICAVSVAAGVGLGKAISSFLPEEDD